MNLQELKQKLETIASTNKILLSGKILESPTISDLLNKYLSKDELEIFGEQTAPNVNILGEEIQIQGKVNLFNLKETSAIIKITIHNNLATLLLLLNLPKNWKFSDSFPALLNPHFINLDIIEGKLILNSSNYTDELIKQRFNSGLNFIGQTRISGFLDVLSPLLGSFNQFLLSGEISSITPTLVNLVADFPDLTLSSIKVTETKIKFITQKPEAIELDDPDEDFLVYPENFVSSEVFIEGDIKIGKAEPVKLSSEIPLISDSLFLRTTFSNGINLPSLNDLATLTGTANLLEPLPEQVTNFGNQLAIKETSFWFNIKKPNIQRAEVKISSQQDYNLFQGLFPSDILRTEKLDFTWFVRNPMSKPETAYVIEGRVRIADAYDVDIQIQTDSELYLSLGLVEGNKIELKTLISLFLPGLEFFPEFAVESFGISARPNSKIYGLNASLEGSWKIIEGLEILELEIEADYDGNAETKTSGKIAGLFIISEIRVYIETTKQAQESNGWEFSGSTGPYAQIEIKALVEDIASLFKVDAQIPQAINDLIISDLHISFNTANKNFNFTCHIEDKELDITVTIAITRQEDNSFKKEFTGYIIVNNLQFNLIFTKDNTSKTLLASYNNPNGNSLTIQTLIAHISNDIATYIPANLQITLKDALFIYSKATEPATKSNFLFGLNLSSQINLTNLPLVGKQLPPEQTISIDDLQLIISSQQLKTGTVENFNNLIPPEITKIPLQPSSETTPEAGPKQQETIAINKGLNLSAKLQFGDTIQTLALPIASENTSTTNTGETSTAITPITPTDNTQWYPLHKTFGPLHFARIGIQYQNATLYFLLDASITGGGLILTLVGLSIGSPLQKFQPTFNLKGIGISYKSTGAVEIGGNFVHTTDQQGNDLYNGAVIIKTETFTISAIGSYTTIDNQPSIFIYGVLDKAIGGPPFFFVTGLALGFAYNRSLILPNLDKIADFPLVKAAYSNKTPDLAGLNQIQNELNPYTPPKIGDIVLAIGIHFTSFKIIDTFALLVANFGNEFSLSLLGISTITSPPKLPDVTVPPLVQVRFVILARFVPAEGTLKVDGKILPDSYLFDKKCQLSGGFAFYSWFKGEHEGDFVLTLGGYHPDFNVPAHYPKVDPLQLNWQINSELSIKGSVYFALTSAAIMAGGKLEAVWQSGNLKAWFIANANFIVAWKPYFYDAQISLRIGASYTFNIKIFGWRIHKTISVEVGADLHIWGPEFAGTATVDLSIISFTIRFGNQSKPEPKAIGWDEFKKSFLPDNVCSIAFESGLTRKLGEGESAIWVVNPKEFCLITNSVIPIKTSNVITGNYSDDVGIAPMARSKSDFTSDYTITVNDNDNKNQNDFSFEPIYKNVPGGLWGESIQPNLNEKKISHVLSGFKIKPANPPKAEKTKAIPIINLSYETTENSHQYFWQTFSTINKTESNIKNTINNESVKNNRINLLNHLGFSENDIDLNEFSQHFEQAFVKNPELTFTLTTT